ncbi:AAA family ATPase [Pseudomonas sp. OIL-1]|uniref:AAA family ATPase n=1 Tax=Pseudomonas sp. OIL-1 TaxID=2706126 RepID=UPI0013A70CFC|nr:AAA family ATPase [Pseudomonas sp. OIL-1]QIB50653.1 ATP-dependent Clp protease ATP-binding subunit [Pseudomonas sp. OIL-1]
MPFINDVLEQNQRASGTLPLTHTSRFRFDPQQVMTLLRSRIVGQGAALDTIEASLMVIKAELGDPRKPLAVILLMGPTGVGKTETVRLLAEAIHGKADALCRIDMNTLAQEHYAASLTGAPPGYVGSKEGTTLFDKTAIEGSYSAPGIVLFDELEKASEPVVRALMNIFDNGQLRLSSGTATLDFRNSLIFMTSNIGAQALWTYQQRQQQGWRKLLPNPWQLRREARLIDQALEKHFTPEFLNRIDQRLRFQRLGDEQVGQLVSLALARLNQRLTRHGLELVLSPDAHEWLGKQGFDRRYGARSMTRAFRQHLEPKVARWLLDQSGAEAGEQLLATLAPDGIRLTLVHPAQSGSSA